jgi:hypothetical protein
VDVLGQRTAGEYAIWYLKRDREKHPEAPDPMCSSDPISLMKQRHGTGKWLDWFDSADWRTVRLNEIDFRRLIFLDSNWTKAEGLTVPVVPDHRLLEVVAHRALTTNYMGHASDEHRRYYNAFQDGFRMTGDRRVMLRSATDGERSGNPSAEFYQMDGAGRGLPYMILLLEGHLRYEPVEAFLAEPAEPAI